MAVRTTGTSRTNTGRSRTTMTQKDKILNRLARGQTLTVAQAEKMNIMSLSSRVNELRKDGHPITSVPYRTRDGRTVVRYSLAG